MHGTILKPISFILRMTQALCSLTNSQYEFDLYHCFDASTVEARFLQIQHSAGFVYGFYQSEMWYTIGEVLTQIFYRVNAQVPNNKKKIILL